MVKKNKKYSAFSMIELTVAIFILSIIMLASVSVFANIVWTRKNALKISRDVETGREAIQIMAKNIRMGSHLGGDSSSIYFFSELTVQCISYRFNANSKVLESSFKNKANASDEDCSPGHVGAYGYTPITSADMQATGSFITKETDVPSKVIGRETINMLVDGKYNLQTTVSFRNYEGII